MIKETVYEEVGEDWEDIELSITPNTHFPITDLITRLKDMVNKHGDDIYLSWVKHPSDKVARFVPTRKREINKTTVKVNIDYIVDRGYWFNYCARYGVSENAFHEGSIEHGDEVEITVEDCKKWL